MNKYEEPFYVRQHGDFGALSYEEQHRWVREVVAEAKNTENCTFFRVSVDDHLNPTMALVEGWKERPKDQGEIRWALAAKEKDNNEQI